jgi:hypothetical protein
MSATQTVFPLSPQNSIVHRGIVPSLCTVAAGSFASDSTYGSGAAQVGSYAAVVVTQSSSSAIRQHDNEVQVNINLVLDLSLASPVANNADELRILPALIGQTAVPGAWQQVLPTPDPNYGLPVIENVQINFLNKAVSPSLITPLNVNGILKAQLLYGGNLALFLVNPATNALTPLQAADINWVATPNLQLIIKVQGTYRGYSAPN